MLGQHESKVTVKREALLEAIKKNRQKHKSDYLEAERGFRDAVRILATVLAADCEAGKAPDLKPIRDLDVPRSHLPSYDRAIAMLEMSVDDLMEISEERFREYVLDEWDWTDRFKAVSSSYGRR
jgi:hypothetical protein